MLTVSHMSFDPAQRGAPSLSVELQYFVGRWHECKVADAPFHVVQPKDKWKVRRVRIELTTLGLWDLRAANCAIAAHAESIIGMRNEVDTILNTHCIPPYQYQNSPLSCCGRASLFCVWVQFPGPHTVQGAAVKECALRAYAAYSCSF